jgi:hypothetical protein
MVISGVGDPARSIFNSHSPALRVGNSTASAGAPHSSATANAEDEMKQAAASCHALQLLVELSGSPQ